MKAATPPQPQIFEPHCRLPFRHFNPVYTTSTIVSADFWEYFKILYGILIHHRQGNRPGWVRTAGVWSNAGHWHNEIVEDPHSDIWGQPENQIFNEKTSFALLFQ